MDVVAIKPGYFGRLREVGETFCVQNGDRASWFVPTKPIEEPPKTEGTPKKGRQG